MRRNAFVTGRAVCARRGCRASKRVLAIGTWRRCCACALIAWRANHALGRTVVVSIETGRTGNCSIADAIVVRAEVTSGALNTGMVLPVVAGTARDWLFSIGNEAVAEGDLHLIGRASCAVVARARDLDLCGWRLTVVASCAWLAFHLSKR